MNIAESKSKSNKTISKLNSPDDYLYEHAESLGLQAFIYAYANYWYADRRWLLTGDPYDVQVSLNEFDHSLTELYDNTEDGILPNADTIYSEMVFDLHTEPVVLIHGDVSQFDIMGKPRYVSVQIADGMGDTSYYILDARALNAFPRVRETGGVYLLGAPDVDLYDGTYPYPTESIDFNKFTERTNIHTATGYGLLRIQADSSLEGDEANAVIIQNTFRMYPYSYFIEHIKEIETDPKFPAYKDHNTWEPSTYGTLLDEVVDIGTDEHKLQFFDDLNRSWREDVYGLKNSELDITLLTMFRDVSLGPEFGINNLGVPADQNVWNADLQIQDGLIAAFNKGPAFIKNMQNQLCHKGTKTETNWFYYPHVGSAGREDHQIDVRGALQVFQALVVSPVSEAVYLAVVEDFRGAPLRSSGFYKFTIDTGDLGLSETEYFWSITMYNNETSTLVANERDLFVIRSEHIARGLYHEDDTNLGHYTFWIAASDNPVYSAGYNTGIDPRFQNWLPGPPSDNDLSSTIKLALRIYGPSGDAVNEEYIPPPLMHGQLKLPHPIDPGKPGIPVEPGVPQYPGGPVIKK